MSCRLSSSCPPHRVKGLAAARRRSPATWGPLAVMAPYHEAAHAGAGPRSQAPPQVRDALAMVEEVAGSRQVISIDVPLMRHALQLKSRYGIAYWDAAVIAGAHRLGA